MKNPLVFSLLITVLLSIISAQAVAEDRYNIIAVVNGEAITSLDLNDRMDVIVSSAGLTDSLKLRQQLAKQSLQTLINETLQRQDAKTHNIWATDKDLAYAIAEIEKHNKVPAGGFNSFIIQRSLTKEALLSQIKAQIVWKKIIANILTNRVHISNFEIEDTIEQLSSSADNMEVFLLEILLPIGDNAKETLLTAKGLIEKINSGTDFSEIARQFSQGSTASEGGVIGWILQKQLGKELQDAVKNMDEHTLAPPIISEDGVRIIKIGDRKNRNVKLNKDQIRATLKQKKIELESKKYIKELRSKAFIEVRI